MLCLLQTSPAINPKEPTDTGQGQSAPRRKLRGALLVSGGSDYALENVTLSRICRKAGRAGISVTSPSKAAFFCTVTST